MKIACIGNMNNMMFQLQRYLVDEGYDITLILLNEFDHFLPQSDLYFNPYEHYKIINTTWSKESFFNITTSEIETILNHYDFYIGTDIAPALMFRIGKRLDAYMPHGSDIFKYPFNKSKNMPIQLWEINDYRFAYYQKIGVKKSNFLCCPHGGDLYEIPILKLRNNKNRFYEVPYFYEKQLDYKYLSSSFLGQKISELKSKHDFLIFHHTSIKLFGQEDREYFKGTHRLINAFHLYLQKTNSEKKALLILLEYGEDVAICKEYISKLGIEDYIYWLPKSYRKDILSAINEIDIGVGELGNMGWLTYGVIVEFMLLKKPMIHYRDSEKYRRYYNTLYPMIDTNNSEEICNIFLDYTKNKIHYLKMGEDAYNWYMDEIDTPSIHNFISIIAEKQSSNKIVFHFVYKFGIIFNPWYVYASFFQFYYLCKGNFKRFLGIVR